jgi:hypothetical protein
MPRKNRSQGSRVQVVAFFVVLGEVESFGFLFWRDAKTHHLVDQKEQDQCANDRNASGNRNACNLIDQLAPMSIDGSSRLVLAEYSIDGACGKQACEQRAKSPSCAMDGDMKALSDRGRMKTAKTPHSFEPAPGAKSTPLGTLNWIRFSITLWLPESWTGPASLHATQSACSE